MTMDVKQILDTAYLGLMNQGKPSKDGRSCKYLSDDGCKCAVGLFVNDPELAKKWDDGSNNYGTGISSVLERGDLPLDLKWMYKYESLLERLQNIHDTWDAEVSDVPFRDHLKYNFEILYTKRKLEMPEWKDPENA